jgi:hypothetical protein
LGFKFWFERALFAALELPRSERVRVVITLGSVASWAARTRVSRRTWPAAVLRPGLALAITLGAIAAGTRGTITRFSITAPWFALAIARWACWTITGFSIARPGLALAIRRFAITAPRLSLTITSRACWTITGFSITRPGLALAIARRPAATGRTS